MADLTTNYMGFHLKNPIIVSACSLTNSAKRIKRCADAGAGAVVISSLFEEQIRSDAFNEEVSIRISGHPEAMNYIENMSMLLGPSKYINLIKEAKSSVSIPVIASLNCVSHEWWMDYALQIEEAGADALELNIAIMPNDLKCSDESIARIYFTILKEVKDRIRIPIAVKLAPYFTCISRMANELSNRGADALVLFNRYFQFDINIDKLKLTSGYRFSSEREIYLSLRWVALLYGRIESDLVGATGIHNGEGAIKHLLAGASAIQICSTLYLNGMKQIEQILGFVDKWMDNAGFNSIDQIKGKMSQKESKTPKLYERLQHIKSLSGNP
ncbi:dihydroorotate dehydrogenase-like protein [Candidatus Poribacteria bacterium]|nr:dihydroorotate dehydrogenase-like protein [Candidatus Poribacteria bacterium]